MRLLRWLFKQKPLSQMDIYEIAESHRARFLQGEAKAVARIVTSYQEAEAGVKKSLAEVEAKIAAYYAGGGEPGEIAASWLNSQARYHELITQIEEELAKFADVAKEITVEGQSSSLKAGAESIVDMVKPQITGGFNHLSHSAFKDMVGTLSNGSALYDLFKQIGPNAVAGARGVFGQAMVEGWNPRKTASALEDTLGLARNRAVMIARTESIRAYRIAGQRQMMANQDVVEGWVWYASHTDHTCPVCLAMDGSEHPVGEIMDSHPNCVIGETLVTVPGASVSSKRWYSGKVVKVATRGGHVLTVTPNHPVLTPNGYVAAGELVEGGYIVCSPNPERTVSAIYPHDNNVPSEAQEVARLIRELSPVSLGLVPVSAEDFHGDGIGGQVDIVRANCHLCSHAYSPLPERFQQDPFGNGAGFSDLFPVDRSGHEALNSEWHPANSVMSGLNAISPELGGTSSLLDTVRGSEIANDNAGLQKAAVNRGPTYSETFGERVLASTGEILADKIISVEVEAFHGEVFNFETRTGWYIANGIILHNCRCTMVPLVKSLAGIVSEGEGQEPGEDGLLSVPPRQSGSDWFAQQAPEMQRATLGPSKFDLYSAGKIDLQDLVENTYDDRWGKGKKERSLKSLLQMVDAGTTYQKLQAHKIAEEKAKQDAKLVAHANAIAEKLAKIEAKQKYLAEKAAAEAQAVIDKAERAAKKAQKVADEAKAAKAIQDDHTVKMLDSLEMFAPMHGGDPGFDYKGYFKKLKEAYPHADVTDAEMLTHWKAHAGPPPEAVTKDLGYLNEHLSEDGHAFASVEGYIKYLISEFGSEWTPAQVIAKAKAEWKTDKTGYNAKGVLAYAKKLGIEMPETAGKGKPPTVVPSSPPPASTLKLENWKLDPEGVVLGGKMTAGQGGSNPGGFYTGTDGGKYYVKFYTDAAQAYNEQLANSIYRELGITAADTTVFNDSSGRTVYVSKIIDNEGQLGASFGKARAEKILDGFSADVLLANWDVVGLKYDNIVKLKGDDVARIDNGGSLLYRATAGRKEPDRLNKLDEWEYFASANSKYSRVFSEAGVFGGDDLGTKAIKQIEEIEEFVKRVGGWRRYIDETVPGMDQADRDTLVKVMERRVSLLGGKRKELIQEANGVEITASQDSKFKLKNFTRTETERLNQWIEKGFHRGNAGYAGSIWESTIWAGLNKTFDSLKNQISAWTGSSKGHAFHQAAQGVGPVAKDMRNALATRRERWDKLVELAGLTEAPKSFTVYRGMRDIEVVNWVAVAWQDEENKFMRALTEPTASWATHSTSADKFYGSHDGVKWKADIPFENTFFDKWVDDHTFISSFWGENEIISGGAKRNAIAVKKEDVKVRLGGVEYTYDERDKFFAAYQRRFGKLPTVADIKEDADLTSLKSKTHGSGSMFGL